ncbi:glycosyltransferase [Nocardia brasiliensis]|uniref:Glycosyltransferase n=1 Tax=Nocardia brasiliensis TaxID=37326 RepID=A0A6G9XQU5_NOCBR|nr:glycosyltransferase [Nocardia brasiliensis]QIS03321.1 glycosyltransferase [Nocardia brasiliensis]
MKALLAFGGSRGDAQPGIALARELIGRGHDVRLTVSPNLVRLATDSGVPATPFGLDTDELLRAQFDDSGKGGPLARLRALRAVNRQGFTEMADDLLAVASGVDVVVGAMANEEVARGVAARTGVPFAAVHYFPIRPNRAVPVVPNGFGAKLPGALNRRCWSALGAARAWAIAPDVERLYGTTPRTSSLPDIAIQAYDDRLFPGLRAEWGPDRPFTGFFTQPPGATTRADPQLTSWLAAGSAPVYVGFGSMPVPDLDATIEQVRIACRQIGRRLLFVSGGLAAESEYSADYALLRGVDHTTVLPRCAAVVHHGGAGTTAATLRAGVPAVVCSFMADQPYWGQRVRALGLGAALPFSRLSAAKLTQALVRVTGAEVTARAARFATGFRGSGVRAAADLLEALPVRVGSTASAGGFR